jgi:hypothetical protein
MPLPIGPIVFGAARAAASKFATRGAISSAQFAAKPRLGAVLGKSKMGTLGRGALLGSMFSGGSGGTSGLSSNVEQTGGTSQKQGLDTYGDGIY